MGQRTENLKRIAKKKGWAYVAIMFIAGPFIVVYVCIGHVFKAIGDFMITTGKSF